jgi:molybdopterin converting factor small subunit
MKIRLLAFASASDAVGGSELELELPEGATIGDLKARLERDHAALAGLWNRVAVAVDGELAPDRTVLAELRAAEDELRLGGGADAQEKQRAARQDDRARAGRGALRSR